MPEKIETGIIGFDQRVQYAVKKLPYKDAERNAESGEREYKNFVQFYAAIKARIKDFTDEEKREEIADRLKTALAKVIDLGELGLELLNFDDMAARGAQLELAATGKKLPLGNRIEKERAVLKFEKDFFKNETRCLAFLRAFEGMSDLFFKSVDDEAFLWALEAQYPPLEKRA